ncbi:Unknown protein, partial [Striga hermonthica]
FSGQGDPRVVDEWVQGLEIIFEVMNCPDRYRMLCAQIQLTGDARLWWQAYWSMCPGEKDGCTWDQFKELIREKYYPSYYRADMERQFLALTQGTRSVDKYEREFTRLGAFVPDLVGTETKRAHRFTHGLHPAVHHNIVGHGVQTYARAVAIAQEIDASIRREAAQTSIQPVVHPPAQPKVAQPSTNKNKRKFKGGPDDRRNRQRQKTNTRMPNLRETPPWRMPLWYLRSMCLLALWARGSLEFATAPLLSQYTVITCGKLGITSKSTKKFLSQTASFAASEAAMYSASIVESATHF